MQADQSVNTVPRSWEHIQENPRANFRPTSRNHRSRTRIENCRRNHVQHKLLKSFKSLNKTLKNVTKNEVINATTSNS